MDYAQAKAAAVAAGIPEEDLTVEVIRTFGWIPNDPSAAFTPNEPKLTPEEMKAHLAALQAEGQANQWPALAMKSLSRLAGALLVFVFVVLLSGCATQKAQDSVGYMEQAAIQMDTDYSGLVESMLEDGRKKDLAKADQFYDDAVRSVTRTVKTTKQVPILTRLQAADGKITESTTTQSLEVDSPVVNPVTLQALMARKLEQYAAVELNVKSIRAKVATIARNRANIQALAQGLRSYFQQRADLMDAANQATDLMLGYVDRFVGKKPEAVPNP